MDKNVYSFIIFDKLFKTSPSMKTLKKTFLLIIFIFVCLCIYLAYNTLNFKSKQVQADPIEVLQLNDATIQNFSKAVKIKTVSYENTADFDSIQFDKFSEFLQNTYPLTDSILDKKIFNSYSFLYHLKGSEPALKPIILMGHLDVVPVIEVNITDWNVAPFSGEIKNDTIWGRGTIDDKVGVVGIMEAVENLLAYNFKPKRSIYIALGHDEELGGRDGALVMANYLKENNIEAEFIVDEGGSITQGLIPDIEKDVALIGIAEKGFISLELSIKLEGGHSSMPEKETSIDVMSSAVTKLKTNPFPAKISEPLKGFISYLGPEMPLLNKVIFANQSIFKSVITNVYEGSSTGNALVRTTTSPTIFNSGVKDNIIPQIAKATINFRIDPENTTETVISRVKEIINDGRISITEGKFYSNPSKVSSIEGMGFKTLSKTIKQIFPEVLIAPYLVVGATDSRHFNEVSDNIFRFSPVFMNSSNIKSFHGLNERMATKDFKNSIRFYIQLIKNSTLE